LSRTGSRTQALFAVADYRDFVKRQTEEILRHVASSRPYESANHQLSLRHSDSVAAQLSAELAAQVQVAGIQVTGCRRKEPARTSPVCSTQAAGAARATRSR
jgi:hypothetical protein